MFIHVIVYSIPSVKPVHLLLNVFMKMDNTLDWLSQVAMFEDEVTELLISTEHTGHDLLHKQIFGFKPLFSNEVFSFY